MRGRALASPLHRDTAVPRVGILVGVMAAHLVASAGCYQPELRDCTVHCTAATDCTGGQVCRTDGWCARPELDKCPKGDKPDEPAAMTDAAPASGSDGASTGLCELGCSKGTCVDGVCVIDCGAAGSCQMDITCPANLPCRVVCGDHACAKKINCGLATSCEVQCTGDFSCGDEIQCNANRCEVDCTGASSCKRRTKCMNACACDVSCSGAGSCAEVSECPAMTCRLGNGCSSLLAGCNDC